jgi:hypothetical protein
MPLWLDIGEWIIKGLVWWYGHKGLVDRLAKYTPLMPDPNPPLSQQNNPNLSNPPDRGGIPR